MGAEIKRNTLRPGASAIDKAKPSGRQRASGRETRRSVGDVGGLALRKQRRQPPRSALARIARQRAVGADRLLILLAADEPGFLRWLAAISAANQPFRRVMPNDGGTSTRYGSIDERARASVFGVSIDWKRLAPGNGNSGAL